MAYQTWITVDRKTCEKLNREVEMRELRAYPAADFLRTFERRFQVSSCSCSAALECNLAGVPCRWAFNSVESEPFRD